eukprot:15365057-Ditylum_brightwellii.AAC.2
MAVNKLSTQMGVSAHKMSTFFTKEVKSKFPHKILSHVDWESAYEHIHTIMMEQYANAAAVPTMLGCGAHGHICLVMDMPLYSMLSTTAYAVPAYSTRATSPPRATVVNRETIECQYKIEKTIYDNRNTVEEVVKAQI